MNHVVLLGDSIFDNGAYVSGGEPVIQQLRSRIPKESMATMLAFDGAMTSSVIRQLAKLPADASHLVVSAGGNNALHYSYLLDGRAASAAEGFTELANVRQEFAMEYREMLQAIRSHRKPTLICTIYDSIPGLDREAQAVLSLFNDTIIRAAVEKGLPVLDLRQICDDQRDYSTVSPIEPSEIGGSKIVRAMLRVLQTHDFSRTESVIYC